MNNPERGRLWRRATEAVKLCAAVLWLGATCSTLGACGGDTPTTTDVTADVQGVDAVEGGAFTVAIEASALTGNAPLDVDFTAVLTPPEGVAEDWAGGVTYAWAVDGNPAGEGETFRFSFFRAGAATITVTGRSVVDDQVATDTVTIAVRGCADLRFSGFVVALPTEIVPGGRLVVERGLLVNDGDRVDGEITIAVGLAATEFWDPETGYLSSTKTFDGIASGLNADATIDLAGLAFDLPDDVPVGTYAAFLIADPNEVVSECQESNNAQTGVGIVSIDPNANLRPDLVMRSIDIPVDLVVTQGDDLNYSFTLENIGDADSRQFRFAFWLSRDAVLSPDDDLPIVLPGDQTSRVQNLPPGAALGFARSYRVPDDLDDGQWWILGTVDTTDLAFEHDEDNNGAASAVPFTMQYAAPSCYDLDLKTEGAVTLDTTTSFWGGSVRATVRVSNPGTLPAPAGWVLRAYLSQQASLNPATARLAGSVTGGVIEPGESATFEIIVPITADYPVFPHYLGVWADPLDLFGECSEVNNTRLLTTPVQIEASARVDLAASGLIHHPKSLAAGESFAAQFRVSNLGTTPTTAFRATLALSGVNVFSPEAFVDGRAVLVDRVTIPSLAAGAFVDIIRDVTVPPTLDHTVSAWHFAAIADLERLIGADTNRGNNLFRSLDQITVTGATGGCFEDDLEPNSVALDASLLSPGTYTGLGLCGDADWFAVAVAATQTIRVSVSAAAITSTPALPSRLTAELFDPAGQKVGGAKIGTPYEVTHFLAPVGGLYTVRIAGASNLDRASYTLDVQVQSPSSGVDVALANLDFDASAGFPGGRLALKFTEANLGTALAAGFPRVVRLSRAREGAAGVELGVFDAAPLAGRTQRSAELLVDLPTNLEGGAWYVVVTADTSAIAAEVNRANDRVVAFPLSIDVARTCLTDRFEPNDVAEFATVSTAAVAAQRFVGAIICPGGQDWYRVDLDGDRSLKAVLRQAYDPARGRATVDIVEPSGVAVLATAVVSAEGSVELQHNWLSGPHFVRVTHANPDSGLPITYDLTVSTATSAVASRCQADPREPDNAVASAVPMGCAPVTATLCRGDLDHYRVQATAGAPLSFALNHPGGSLKVALLSADGKQTLAQRQGNGTTNHTPSASGPLVLRVESRVGTSGLTTYPYTLDVGGIVAADVATLGLAAESSRAYAGEELGVVFELINACTQGTPSFRADVLLSTDTRPGPDDLRLATFELPAGLRAGESFPFDDKLFIPASTAPGEYFLVVVADATELVSEPDERNNIAAIPLSVRGTCLPDRFELNNTTSAATPAIFGAVEDVGICPGDLDWFEVRVPAGGGQLIVEAYFEHVEGDLDLRVYDVAQGFTVPIATGASRDDDERIVLNIPVATTLFIRVNGYLSAAAPYELWLEFQP